MSISRSLRDKRLVKAMMDHWKSLIKMERSPLALGSLLTFQYHMKKVEEFDFALINFN
jgi:hypothetical protein